LARRAADILLEPGEWLIREGEEPRFFVILEGELEVLKDIVGQHRLLGRSVAGEFAGEIPIFMGTANPVSIRAMTKCRACWGCAVRIGETCGERRGEGSMSIAYIHEYLALEGAG
jgi:CRP-like cAMP-binding protein